MLGLILLFSIINKYKLWNNIKMNMRNFNVLVEEILVNILIFK